MLVHSGSSGKGRIPSKPVAECDGHHTRLHEAMGESVACGSPDAGARTMDKAILMCLILSIIALLAETSRVARPPR